MAEINHDPINIQRNFDRINYAIALHNTFHEILLPPHCTLPSRNLLQPSAKGCVIIDFVHPYSNHIGCVLLMKPNEDDEDGIKMMCSIDRYNGYFIEITVNSVEEVLEVTAFCQNLLQYQPNQDELEFVRVPRHLLDHWCIPAYLLERNLENAED
jgi:hypothetical protein